MGFHVKAKSLLEAQGHIAEEIGLGVWKGPGGKREEIFAASVTERP